MAGVVSDDDRTTIRQIAEQLRLAPPERIGVDHDIRIALAGGLAGQPGIALIVGTGSSCYGRTAGWALLAGRGMGAFVGRFRQRLLLGLASDGSGSEGC